ncbi:synaptogenesis protein syg-2-like [Tachypleus tridentatus]|uniref:synaptogenesis protein syg-2-like n=1 Tax=Tachypleus tridentatus TaxID=6853 RepID=UPI003FD5FADC
MTTNEGNLWRKQSRILWMFTIYAVTVRCLGHNETFQNIKAIVGRAATLPCNVRFPEKKEDIALVLWFRDNSGVPVYSFDARSGSFYKSTHFTDDPLGSRAHFDINYKPPVLKIENLTKDDEGQYECRVDYRKARTEKWRILLSIIVPPKSVIIMDENGQHLQGLVGPFHEGSVLFLTCEADGGDPPPAVTWWQDSALLDNDYIITPLKISRNEFIIEALQREHLWSKLTCQASNTDSIPPVFSSIVLDLNLKPLQVRITTRKQPLSAGRRVEIECQSVGSRPPARMTWWKDGRKIFSASAITTTENITVSKLDFTPETDDDKKLLTCRADNPDVGNSAKEAEWKLDVIYVPILSLTFWSNGNNDSIREGDDVYFECKIRANPQIIEIGWQFNGKNLLINQEEGILITNESLVLKSVTKDRSGLYRCLADNVKGQGQSAELVLIINHVPVCKNDQKKVYKVAPGERISVKCNVEASPSNVSFKWSFKRSSDMIKVNTFTSTGTQSELVYRPDVVDDYGVLYCWASNELGIQKQPCNYSIVPAGPPEALRNCKPANRSTTVIVVKCVSGYDGELDQQFHLEIFNTVLERLQRNITNTDRPVFVVNELPSETSFIFVLYASNSKGRSNTVVLTVNTLSDPGRKTVENQTPIVSPLIRILIGGSLTLLLTGVIIAVFAKFKRQCYQKGPRGRNSTDKNDTMLQKDVEEFGDNNDPDVIPAILINTHGRNEEFEMGRIPLHKGTSEDSSFYIRTTADNVMPRRATYGEVNITSTSM